MRSPINLNPAPSHWLRLTSLIIVSVLLLPGLSSCNRSMQSVQTEVWISSEIPELKGRINDYAGLLSSDEIEELSEISRILEERTGAQLVILIVPTTGERSIEDYSLAVMQAWKIGRAGYDDGSAIVLAIQDRRVRIELGYGTNTFFTNDMAQTVIDSFMMPSFIRGRYFEGLLNGALEMASIIEEKTPEQWRPE